MMNLNTGKAQNKEQSIEQSINLIVTTPKGERLLNRNFGSSLVQYLHKPITNVALNITGELVRSLEANDSRIDVQNASVEKINHDDYSLTIGITYNNNQTIQVNL